MSPYPPLRNFADIHDRHVGDTNFWRTPMSNVPLSEPNPLGLETSGDEVESKTNQKASSLEASFAGMQWSENSVARSSISSTSSSDPGNCSLGIASAQGPWTQMHPGVQLLSTGPSVPTPPHPVFPMPMALDANATRNASSSILPPLPVAESHTERPNNGYPNIQTSSTAPDPRRRPQIQKNVSLSRLRTSNLGFLHPPSTPSRLTGSLLSPGSAFASGTFDFSAWLEEPILPSPMYEVGACTGWSGLLSANDTGKTPTAETSRMYLLKSPQSHGTETSSVGVPVLISSSDWWARDKEAQQRFHCYILASLPTQQIVRSDDCRSTLAASAMSRFLAYTSFLWQREPSAPQPPFLHRHMLMMQRDKLPAPLAIARAVLAALAMRLPTSEVWAWRQVGSELGQVITAARDAIQKCAYAESHAFEQHLWLQQATSFSGLLELLALLQALWCYVVVGAMGNFFESDCGGEFERLFIAHRVWDPLLFPNALDALQQLTALVAEVTYTLQQRQWRSSENSSGGHAQEFLWWGVCESARRSVLCSHALLMMLRFMQSSSPTGLHPDYSIKLGVPPIHSSDAEGTFRRWSAVMYLELPHVAEVFEADNVTLWRSNLKTWADHYTNVPTLALFTDRRPQTSDNICMESNQSLCAYFQQHDEFTNVCLSVLYGLADP